MASTINGEMIQHLGCSECDNKFTRLEDLKKHEESHSKDKSFTCSKCNTEFTKSSGLEKHMLINQKQFGCCDCDKIFNCKNELEGHEKAHTERKQEPKKIAQVNEKPLECNKTFEGLEYLKAHEKTHSKSEVCPE